MRQFGVVFLFLITLAAASTAMAQPNDRIPRGIEALRQQASSKTDLTLDHSMLILASKLEPDNEGLRRVIAGVSGISIHSYRFPGAGQYDLDSLSSVKADYQAAGWKQLMNNHENSGGQGVLDLWVRLENNAISDVAILLVKSDEIDFVAVAGSLSPLDISHLSGHFGIPKIEGGVLVPNSERRP